MKSKDQNYPCVSTEVTLPCGELERETSDGFSNMTLSVLTPRVNEGGLSRVHNMSAGVITYRNSDSV